jgi:hypothetical protein
LNDEAAGKKEVGGQAKVGPKIGFPSNVLQQILEVMRQGTFIAFCFPNRKLLALLDPAAILPKFATDAVALGHR